MHSVRIGVRILLGAMILSVPGREVLRGQEVTQISGRDRTISPRAVDGYTVGSLAGEEWETFADLRTVAFDGAGNLYILDGGNHRVVVVDPSGALVREFGKEGDGPGELRLPFGMVVAPDGTTAIQDMGHQAFVVFGPDGSFIRNAPNEFQNGLVSREISYHPRHGAVGVSTSISISSRNGRTTSEGASGAPVRFIGFAEGVEPEELHTAWRRPPEPAKGGGASFSSGGSGSFRLSGMSALRAFDPIIRTAVLPNGRIVLTDSTAYDLKLIGPEGGHDRTLHRPLDPRPVTKRDQAAEKKRRFDELEEGDGPRMIMSVRGGSGGGGTRTIGGDAMKGMMTDRIENMVFAEEIPVIADIATDWEGRIWVERTGDRVGEDGATDVLTADGRYLGTIPPDGIRIPDAFGPDGLMAVIEKDEFDVEFVVVRRLPEIR